MAIDYVKYELLEFFSNEPSVIDPIAEIFKYNIPDKLGFDLFLSFWTYDDLAFLYLKYKNIDDPIFSITIKNVTKFEANKEQLIIYTSDNKLINIYVKETFFLKIDNF